MTPIEAGIICRDSGFNWGRGSWWQAIGMSDDDLSFIPICAHEHIFNEIDTNKIFRSNVRFIPDITRGATRGVILEWAREKTGIEMLHVYPTIDVFDGEVYWDFGGLHLDNAISKSATEIVAYARLCQWVKENFDV